MCRGAARGCLGWHTSARHALSATHTGCRLATETMKKAALLLMPLLCVAYLYTGYYETRWAEDNRMVFFIKQYPSLTLEFPNIFASDRDDKPLEQLTAEERDTVRAYCKYRLGIETRLETQAELERCKGL